jgi:hypothetical protein
MSKLNLPFTVSNLKGGSKKSFKILSENEINKKVSKNKSSIFNMVKQFFWGTNNSVNSSNKQPNKKDRINYVKGTSTKEYYKNLGLGNKSQPHA